MTVKEVINNKLTNEQISDLFYDWFCSDKALVNRGKQLIRRLRKIAKNTTKFNIETTEVWFNNNCPCFGELYDSISIKDEQNNIFYYIIPRSGHKSCNHRAEIWNEENDKPIIVGTWQDVVDYFNQ